jgi:hypothetical protein
MFQKFSTGEGFCHDSTWDGWQINSLALAGQRQHKMVNDGIHRGGFRSPPAPESLFQAVLDRLSNKSWKGDVDRDGLTLNEITPATLNSGVPFMVVFLNNLCGGAVMANRPFCERESAMKSYIILSVFMVLLLGACGGAEESGPATARPERVNAAQTAFAQATNTPRPRATNTPLPSIETDLARTTARMANAILAQDTEAYFNLVWPEDPIFLQEHRRWAELWANETLTKMTISLSLIEIVNETEARARLSMAWTRQQVQDNQSGGAIFSARFRRQSPTSDLWLFAGEAWEVVRLFWDGLNWTILWDDSPPPADATELMRVYYLTDHGPVEGTQRATATLLEDLPGIYNVVREELGLTPAEGEILHVRFYDQEDNLRVMVRFDVSPTLRYWNMPGEGVRYIVKPTTGLPPSIQELVTGVTTGLLYQMAGNTNPYPFWLLSGMANFIYGQNYQTITWINNEIENVQAMFPEASSDEARWTVEHSPLSGGFASASAGHIFLLFLEENFGTQQRQAFVNAVAQGADLETASQTSTGKTFDTLNAEWVVWVGQQLR